MFIGIDVGGTNMEAGLIDENGNIIGELMAKTKRERPFEEIDIDLIHLVKDLVAKHNVDKSQIKSIGIGLPGVTDVEKGIYVSAPNLKVHGFPIKEVFEKEFSIPTYIDNDARSAALAEALFGSMKDFYVSVTITLGTGIGAGIIENKKIFEWPHDYAGEFGHMVIVVDGEQCGCGRKGCWEKYASSSALKRMAGEAAKVNEGSLLNKLSGWEVERVGGKILFDAVRQGDQTAKKVLDKYICYLSEGIINIVNALAPQGVAIGGGISKQGDILIKPVREYVEKYALCREVALPEIRAAKFGRQAGIIGAAMLWTQR